MNPFYFLMLKDSMLGKAILYGVIYFTEEVLVFILLAEEMIEQALNQYLKKSLIMSDLTFVVGLVWPLIKFKQGEG